MKTHPLLLALILGTSAGAVRAQHHAPSAHAHAPSRPSQASAYAGDIQREIKALSAEEQRAWLEGQGAGLARAAELNRHPGPMHVLELAEQLALTADQERRTRALMDSHKAEVRALGGNLIALERELDRLFASGAPVNSAEASRIAEAIGAVAARIRASHLRTHIEQTAMMTPEQVDRYIILRGYAK